VQRHIGEYANAGTVHDLAGRNLVNFGVLPITFVDPLDYEHVDASDDLVIPHAREQIHAGVMSRLRTALKGDNYPCVHDLPSRQVELIVAGSLSTFL
jgi:aconitate hydratase